MDRIRALARIVVQECDAILPCAALAHPPRSYRRHHPVQNRLCVCGGGGGCGGAGPRPCGIKSFESARRALIRAQLKIMGIDYTVLGEPFEAGPAVVVCNHLLPVLDAMLIKLLDPSAVVVTKVPLQTLRLQRYARGPGPHHAQHCSSSTASANPRIITPLRM